jgi:negative regulator of sigma E activity
MVDYYALISPTIEPLADASPEERKVVYDRLVLMLDQQLRAADPPRSDKDILKERINLEAAIRRVERRILADKKKTPETGKPVLSGDMDIPRASPPPEPMNERSINEAQTSDPVPAPEAQKIREPKPDIAPAERQEPAIASLPKAAWPMAAEPVDQAPVIDVPAIDEPASYELDSAEPESVEASSTEPHPFEPEPISTRSPIITDVKPEAFFDTGDEPAAHAIETTAAMEEPVAPVERGMDARPALPSAADLQRRNSGLSARAKGLWLRIGIIGLVILALVAAIAGLSDYLSQRSAERLASRTPTPQAEAVTTEQKLTDRLPVAPDEPAQAKGTPSQSGQNAADTGTNGDQDVLLQRAVLVEEAPGGVGDPKRTTGRVTWKLETGHSGSPAASVIEVKASIDLADAGLSATIVFKRNRDQTSANTHLIEITMIPSPDNPNGKVRDVSVPELRTDEKSRGATLQGIAVPVSDNVFLIGLNGLPADMQRNIELLRSRNFILIPMRYSNGRRALLLFEKGKPGERIFEDAMQAWQ